MNEITEGEPGIEGLANEPGAPEAEPASTLRDVAVDDSARPWHGAANPLEALFQHFTAEIAALKAKSGI